ncbi:MAG: WYL domain-containing protein, partial [Actinobacteria bacterium]
KAEHDFRRPADFDPRPYAARADWQFGDPQGTAEIWVSERIAWLVERHFGRFGEIRREEGSEDVVFVTDYASPRMLVSWVLRLGEHARLLSPEPVATELDERAARLEQLHAEPLELAGPARRKRGPETSANGGGSARRETTIRPERFARLVTLASILIDAGRRAERLQSAELCERLQISDQELREDVNVLNVVNFGGGSYVLYAEVDEITGEIEVDPEPYSDNFARPARLLPVEAKALVAAIDLIGDHLPAGSLSSARDKIVDALGADPMEQGLQVARAAGDDSEIARVVSEAIKRRRLMRLDYYKQNEDEYTARTIEPYYLINSREGWYVASYDPAKEAVRHFRLDRIREAEMLSEKYTPRPEVKPSADLEGWTRTGEVEASRIARVWVSPDRARWAREERTVSQELSDGSVIVELPFAGSDYLVREVLKEAGDAAVVEPEDAREAVLEAVQRVRNETKAAH